MVTKVKKGMHKKEIELLLKRHDKSNMKKIDVEKYCGVLKLKEDPLTLQKQLRNEWK